MLKMVLKPKTLNNGYTKVNLNQKCMKRTLRKSHMGGVGIRKTHFDKLKQTQGQKADPKPNTPVRPSGIFSEDCRRKPISSSRRSKKSINLSFLIQITKKINGLGVEFEEVESSGLVTIKRS